MASHATTAARCAGLLAALLFASLGCGKKGPPRPPEPRSPRAPESVEARQIGPEVRVWFAAPELRGGRPSQMLGRAELKRVDYAPGFTPPPDPDAFRRRGKTVGTLPAGALPGPAERIDVGDTDLAALDDRGIGSTLRYAVQLFDARGRPSPLGAAVDLVPAALLPPPEDLSAEATGDGIRLVWAPLPTPPGADDEVPPVGVEATAESAASEDEAPPVDGEAEAAAEPPASDAGRDEQPGDAAALQRYEYNVYRGPPNEPAPESPINPVPLTDTQYLDTDPQEGERYRYVVRVLLADGTPPRESASSTPIVVLARDLIAPQPPTGLVAVQEGISVRLFWKPNDERDVAGYRVYRLSGQNRWQSIGPALLEQTSYNDRDVSVGQTVAYRISAVDRADPANESGMSTVALLDILAEPTAPGVERDPVPEPDPEPDPGVDE